ncbi:MAG: family 10 glycosylhydrolase [Candidatus Gastranaerophilales bacterium]|nr:family 10 glycosylhydrolase [Candidatus Gastranaerophilales bacterium]
MGKFFNLVKFFICVLFLSSSFVYANALPISEQEGNSILSSEVKTINYYEKKEEKPLYVEQKEEIKLIDIKIEAPQKPIVVEKPVQNIEIKKEKNIIIKENNDRILSQSTRKINAIYPTDDISPTNTYPGYRGPNQLVIYNRDYGRTTQTNEFGKEAVVVDDMVVALTGANSNIPKDGYVISGHGSAKKWINDNLKIGTKVKIEDRVICAYTTIESYRYFAKSKINAVEDILVSTKYDYKDRDDKFVYYYLKKAKQQYRKSKKDCSDISLNCAKESIRFASLAFQYTLPYVKNELKGTWIRPTEKTVQEVQKTLDKIKDTGINNVFLETYYHGKTIFPSVTMKNYGFEEQNPEFSNFDALAVWIKEAHRRGIKVHVWFESFYIGNKNPANNPKSILAVKPEWMNRTKQKADFEGYVSHPQEHNGYFLDPANPEVINFLLQLIGEISAKYNIDGFNIDYVRYPNISKENLNNQWGYTKYAREEFFLIYAQDPMEIQPKGAMWDSWCEYRRDKITSYIRKVSHLLQNRNITFSAVIFPDYKVSLQTKFQDWTRWVANGYMSAITPLILTSDEELAKSMLEEIKKKTSNEAYVYPGLFAGFIESDPEDLLRQIHIVRKLKLNGIILFDWAHLSDNYKDVLKTSAFKEQTY